MAENEASATFQDQGQAQDQQTEQPAFQYPIKVEDVGPATKKVTIEIPAERIQTKLAEQFKELRSKAAIPGFRPGHAPQKLVEKRFNTDVKDEVRRSLISESYQQALEKNELQVLGEPEFEDSEKIVLPESGPLTFTFQVEVQPNITLPELTGLKVRRPKVDVKDEHVEEALRNLRDQQGALVPVEDRGVQARDYLLSDVHVKAEGNEVIHQHDAQVVARAGRIAGIQIDDLDKQLEGMKPGETRTLNVKAPETHADEKLRGKDVQIEITLKDLKRLEAAELNQEFLNSLGFQTEQELRDALRQQMIDRIQYDVQQAMREQVHKYLLEKIPMELPAKLSKRQEDRVVSRRAVDLMMRGMSRDQVDSHLEQLRGGAADEAARELKLFFILEKVATQMNVDVDEAELNGRIAVLAAQRGRRPEKVKQEMAGDGTLMNLYLQMREQKAVDQILASAQIEEVDMPAGETK